MKCNLCENVSVVRGYCRSCYAKLKKDDEIIYKKHSETLVYGGGINDMPKGWQKPTKEFIGYGQIC